MHVCSLSKLCSTKSCYDTPVARRCACSVWHSPRQHSIALLFHLYPLSPFCLGSPHQSGRTIRMPTAYLYHLMIQCNQSTGTCYKDTLRNTVKKFSFRFPLIYSLVPVLVRISESPASMIVNTEQLKNLPQAVPMAVLSPA
jgi:hypothetical protein